MKGNLMRNNWLHLRLTDEEKQKFVEQQKLLGYEKLTHYIVKTLRLFYKKTPPNKM